MSQAIEESLDENDDNKEYLYRIIRQVDRLNKLLSNFFTYARPGRPKKTKISLVEIVDETRQLVSDKLTGKNIQLVENYEPNLPYIFADPGQMQQVFLNLMLNSIDAVDKNGVIEITARFIPKNEGLKKRISSPDFQHNRDYIKVYFKDNGCGMNSEVTQKAFKPFYSTKPHGAGLGLAIVSRILNENNASIYLDPVEHKGTTFILFIETS
jgi:signal transduction histidine kinase